YLDYSREAGEWEPNRFGGRENLEAIEFIKEFNQAVIDHFPDVQTIAEESTAFNGVSKPVYHGGLGFGMKWMMGWMHDTLEYFKRDPVYRQHHHNEITFSLAYAFTENFMLPLSHDEVVYGKGSLLGRMPGDDWQRFANLRLLFSYMYTHPGAKLLFMGGEFGQSEEWKFDGSLDWHLLQYDSHKGVQSLVKALNHVYKSEPALYEKAFSHEGFEWIELNDHANSVLSYVRKGHDRSNDLVVINNMTPVVRGNHRVGIPAEGTWEVVLNSDMAEYWGSGMEHATSYTTEAINWNGREHSIAFDLPPLACLILKRV
nr:alpha amylase C-terminal domain-containing protein [Saprospiraceae bacterium]